MENSTLPMFVEERLGKSMSRVEYEYEETSHPTFMTTEMGIQRYAR